jgi:hypothetical protein
MVAKAQEPGIRVGMDKFAPAFSGMTAEEQPNWNISRCDIFHHGRLTELVVRTALVNGPGPQGASLPVPTFIKCQRHFDFFPFPACSFLTAVCFLLLSLSFLPPLSPIVITT